MGLVVHRLKLEKFRGFDRTDIEFDEKMTILTGPNAVGKTSIIEALEILTTGESFKNPSWADLIGWGQERCFISLSLEGDDREVESALSLVSGGKKEIQLNGKKKRGFAHLRSLLPSVVFTPDDLELVKSSSEMRRRSLDSLGARLSPAYSRLKSEYDRVLRHKNTLLKEESIDREALYLWNLRLVQTGAKLMNHRKGLFEKVASRMGAVYSDIAPGESLTAEYVDSWSGKIPASEGESISDSMAAALIAREAEELNRRASLVGPHRDEIRFLLRGKDARAFASQGQQRTIALAWKLAEVDITTEVTGYEPLLLLDDVMSELDENRRAALLNRACEGTQTVITTTNLGYFSSEILSDATVVRLG